MLGILKIRQKLGSRASLMKFAVNVLLASRDRLGEFGWLRTKPGAVIGLQILG